MIIILVELNVEYHKFGITILIIKQFVLINVKMLI